MRRALSLLALALAGCAVGPNYRAPKPAAPAQYGEAEAPSSAPAADLNGWWHAYNDPKLDRLVAIALADGLNVKLAATRIGEARAQERVARSQFFPQINASGGVTSERFSKNAGFSSIAQALGDGGASGGSTGGSGGGSSGGIALPGGFITTYAAGFDASWELDVFGGVRRQVEGARARIEAAVWNARDAQVSLVAEVVDDYMAMRLAQERETIARQEVDRQTRNLQIMGENAKVGLTPQGDIIRQRAQLAQAQASVGPIVAEGKAEMHAIAVLLGKTPDAMIVELSVPRPQLPAPPAVPPGLPSDLLRRRPDIRAAERNLAASTADIGVAVADLYPRFNLTSMAQLISTALGNLFTADSAQVMGAAQATFPILDFGRRTGTVTLRKAQADESYVQYQQTVLGAFRDVEDALIRIRTEQQRNVALKAGVVDAQRALQAVDARYRTGLVDLTSVLDAQQSVLSDRDQLAQSDAQLRRDLISLYKALGGGWDGMPAVDGPSAKPMTPDYSAPKHK
ncbi:efflux transporter outer membrane subunit [Sphingomonas nostoxanthinifaciens]|uniref:efflux transporter outer membrane subunit n=1 Tax=Sphingomonas nostoxanthinifaciens TaxID=2872652 RepID=UPI001CC1CD90|nr:efflux transporter outer membrane subunit [Sphingomonas nostoxanthinifaciens]UAK26375.1 efflux transporter outer membrane subunit [Sphingomonas nostoxanthinifaciens]